MSSGHRTIGEVLALLADEHPNLTISKIRFLESQGLISPQRGPTGYRKFFDADIERLHWVLAQQRDRYLPLKEIKRLLAAGPVAETSLDRLFGEPDTAPALFTTGTVVAAESTREAVGADADTAAADAADDGGDTAGTGAADSREAGTSARLDGSVSLTTVELARAADVDPDLVAELLRLRILEPVARTDTDGPVFDHEALLTAQTAAALAARGIPARSLRMFKTAAEREAGVYEQVLAATIARGDSSRLRSELAEIVELTESLHRLLLRRMLRPHLD